MVKVQDNCKVIKDARNLSAPEENYERVMTSLNYLVRPVQQLGLSGQQ